MVKPVDDAMDFSDNGYNNLAMVMEKNDNLQQRDDLFANEKINHKNRAFPSSFLSFNRKIIVNEEEGMLRNVNNKQVMSFKL